MKILLFFILLANLNISLFAINKDSLNIEYSFGIGVNGLGNNNEIYKIGYYRYSVDTYIQSNSFNLGMDACKNFTKNKKIVLGFNYLFSDSKLMIENWGYNSYKETAVRFHGFSFTNIYQYQVKKWVNINTGFQHYFNLVTKVNNKDNGKDFQLLKSDNTANIKNYTFGFLIGAEFNIYKKWGIEFNYFRSFYDFFKFDKSYEVTPKYKNKLQISQINLKYRL